MNHFAFTAVIKNEVTIDMRCISGGRMYIDDNDIKFDILGIL